MERVAPGAKDVPFEINRFRVVRRDGENMNLIAILHRELFERRTKRFLVASLSNLQAQHAALFVSVEPLHFDVAERRSGKDASGELEGLAEICFSAQLVYGRAAHHTIDGHRGAERRNPQRVPILETLQVSPDAVQEKIVA